MFNDNPLFPMIGIAPSLGQQNIGTQVVRGGVTEYYQELVNPTRNFDIVSPAIEPTFNPAIQSIPYANGEYRFAEPLTTQTEGIF
jgi:hypothetical protein